MTTEPLTTDDIAHDIDAFTKRHIEPWRRKAAQDDLLLLFARWTDHARAKLYKQTMQRVEELTRI